MHSVYALCVCRWVHSVNGGGCMCIGCVCVNGTMFITSPIEPLTPPHTHASPCVITNNPHTLPLKLTPPTPPTPPSLSLTHTHTQCPPPPFLQQHQGAWEEAQAAYIIHQCLVALAAMHDQGIVNGDVSPDNWLLSQHWQGPVLMCGGAENAGEDEVWVVFVGGISLAFVIHEYVSTSYLLHTKMCCMYTAYILSAYSRYIFSIQHINITSPSSLPGAPTENGRLWLFHIHHHYG